MNGKIDKKKLHWRQNMLMIGQLIQGIAKEQAPKFWPEGLTKTTLYMNGSLRSWVHYIELRSANGTKEHMDIAKECALVIAKIFPMAKDPVIEELHNIWNIKKEQIIRDIFTGYENVYNPLNYTKEDYDNDPENVTNKVFHLCLVLIVPLYIIQQGINEQFQNLQQIIQVLELGMF